MKTVSGHIIDQTLPEWSLTHPANQIIDKLGERKRIQLKQIRIMDQGQALCPKKYKFLTMKPTVKRVQIESFVIYINLLTNVGRSKKQFFEFLITQPINLYLNQIYGTILVENDEDLVNRFICSLYGKVIQASV